MSYAFYPNLEAEVQIPENGILSRTLYNDDRLKVVIFGFAPPDRSFRRIPLPWPHPCTSSAARPN